MGDRRSEGARGAPTVGEPDVRGRDKDSGCGCCEGSFPAVRSGHMLCLAGLSREKLLTLDTRGQTALHLAAKLGNLEAVDYIAKNAPETLDVISNTGENAILVAAGEGKMHCVERLLQGNLKTAMARAMHRDVNGTSVLMAAVARGDNDMALWLLRRFGKALAMLPNNCRILPLHVAAAQGNIEFIRIATKYDSHMVNYRDEFGCTATVYAAQGGCLLCVRYLVEKARSDMGAVSDRGQSLLHVACLAGHSHIVRWIVQRSVPNTILWPTKDNANAVHCAAFSGNVACLGVLLHAIPRKRRRAVLALRDSRGNTPLHLSAINNHIDAALFLLENGADPKLLNGAGQSAEAIARIKNYAQLSKILCNFRGKKHKKNKVAASKSECFTDTIAGHSSGYGSGLSQTLPNGSAHVGSPLTRQLSSGYSSAGGDCVLRENRESPPAPDTLEVRPLGYIASEEGGRIYADCGCQTEPDSLTDRVKLLDLDGWQGEALAAVEQIDRVLDEVDV